MPPVCPEKGVQDALLSSIFGLLFFSHSWQEVTRSEITTANLIFEEYHGTFSKTGVLSGYGSKYFSPKLPKYFWDWRRFFRVEANVLNVFESTSIPSTSIDYHYLCQDARAPTLNLLSIFFLCSHFVVLFSFANRASTHCSNFRFGELIFEMCCLLLDSSNSTNTIQVRCKGCFSVPVLGLLGVDAFYRFARFNCCFLVRPWFSPGLLIFPNICWKSLTWFLSFFSSLSQFRFSSGTLIFPPVCSRPNWTPVGFA